MSDKTGWVAVKVVLVASTSSPSGVATHVLSLAKLLVAHDMLDIVVVPQDGWLCTKLRADGIPFVNLNLSFKPSKFIESSIRLWVFLRSRPQAQVVHLHGRFPLFISLASMVLCRRLCFVATVHQFSGTGAPGVLGWKVKLEDALLKRLKGIACVSEALKEEVVSRVGKGRHSRVHVIPNWIEPLFSSSVLDKNDSLAWGSQTRTRARKKGAVICAVGRLSREKGFDVLIDALYALEKQGYKVRCDIFGDGPERAALLQRIDKYSLKGKVVLRGAHDNVRQLLPHYDLIVVPSRMESFGLVVLEAYDAGIPVVASDVPGLRELVRHKETGLLVKPNNPHDLAAAILSIMHSPSLARVLAENGRTFLKEYFPGPRLVESFVRFYREACGRIS